MSFHFAYITDTHCYPNAPKNFGGGSQMQLHSDEIFSALTKQINDFSPAFVINGGDITCGGDSFGMTSDQHSATFAEAKKISDSFNSPTFHIPGNHDLDPETGSKANYLQHFGYGEIAFTSFVEEDLRFILLDTLEIDRDRTHGHIDADQLSWLETELETAKTENQQVLIFAHHLLMPLPDFSALTSRIDNSDEVIAIIDKFDHVLATFQGHLHTNYVVEREGVSHIVTSAIICYPMMWRKIYVESDQMRVQTSQLNLPEILAKSAGTRSDRGKFSLGSETDHNFTISRSR